MIKRDQERGIIKSDVDPELVIHLIFSYGLDEYFRNNRDEEKYMGKLKEVFKIIREGISAV